jgi:hypothetical protein
VAKKTKLSKSSLHWFIRSRSYVLLAELRRRFDLDGSDEVRGIRTPGGTTYLGLPERAARLIEDLVSENRVGLECLVDVHARLAVGVYAYDLLKAPVGLQRSNPFHRPPVGGHPDALDPAGAPLQDDEIGEAEDAADLSTSTEPAPEAVDRIRPPDRPRFDGPRDDRRQSDRRQGDRREFGRPRGAVPPESGAGPDRRPGARPDLPRRDRPGRPDLPRPRSERPGTPMPGRRPEGRERRGPDRPGTRTERPS